MIYLSFVSPSGPKARVRKTGIDIMILFFIIRRKLFIKWYNKWLIKLNYLFYYGSELVIIQQIIENMITFLDGFFIEAGAYDFVYESTSLYLS